MNTQQKTYIEEHVDLIKNNDWTKFFKGSPRGVGGILYEAGVPFLEKLQYVPNSAFTNSNIQTINIPNNVTIIGFGAFSECRSLTSITIPNNVTSIGAYAFYKCSSLTSVTIPNSVINIGVHAFSDCGELEIKYGGTTAEWSELIGNNIQKFSDTRYTCTCIDGIVKN